MRERGCGSNDVVPMCCIVLHCCQLVFISTFPLLFIALELCNTLLNQRQPVPADDTPIVVSPTVGGVADSHPRRQQEEEDRRIRPYYGGRPSSGAHKPTDHNSSWAGQHGAGTAQGVRAATAPSQTAAAAGPAVGAPPGSAPAGDMPAGSQAPVGRAAALLRLKQQRAQQLLYGAAGPAAAAAAGAEQQGNAQDGSDDGGESFDLRASSKRVQPVARAAAAAAAAPQVAWGAAAAADNSGAGMMWAGERGAAAEAADGIGGTPDGTPESNAKPFLKRRSKAVMGAKLDWSHVKPRTHTRMEDYIGPTAVTPPQHKAKVQQAKKAASPILKKHAGPGGGKNPRASTSAGGAAGLRSSGGWKPGGKLPSPQQDKVARAHARILGGHIPGLDYEVQRYTGITTFSTTGGGAGAGSRQGMDSVNSPPSRAGIRASTPSSPLDDLLAHVNTLLRDFDTRFSTPAGKA